MPIERVFLGWDRPGLSLTVDYLAGRFATDEAFDLGEVLVVVPGGRAGRRLLERLVERSDADRRPLCPPRITTLRWLPELLYVPKQPFAEALAQQLAWVEALRRTPAKRLARLVAQVPEQQDLAGWLSLGEMLGRLHRELAAEAMDFEAVVDCGRRMQGFHEEQRWAALSGLQRDYLATLDRLGLWDRQTARLFAVRQGECRADGPIVLVGTVDLNRLQRMMLEQVADRVSALVFAPDTMADRFDELGCLRPEAWQQPPEGIRDEQIEVVQGPADQASAVVRAIAALDGRYAADEITVGVPDGRIVPYVVQRLRQCGLATRHGVGEPLACTGPYRLLAAVVDYLGQPRFSSFAALVRHPAVEQWLGRQDVRGDWLSQLDRYHTDHLPYRLGGHWLERTEAYAELRVAHEAVEALLRPLSGDPRPLAEWGWAIVDLLVAVYGESPLCPDEPAGRVILAACERIHAALDEHRTVHQELTPSVVGADAIRLALRAAAAETIAAPAEPEAIELVGWLELPLDDAPVLIVTGMNEGIVPAGLGADLFLPNQMRRALGIEDNDRRFARDAYALSALACCEGHLKLIAARRSADGDPLLPSRLLLMSDPQTTARRVRRLFAREELGATAGLSSSAYAGNEGDSPIFAAQKLGQSPVAGSLAAGRAESGFKIPEPLESVEPVESMRVTEFRDYLACPYRYYLRHRLKLAGLEDRAEELDGRAFGSLAHEVLGEFGRGPAANSTDAEETALALDAALARVLKKVYGSKPRSSIRIQAEQLRARLRRFAQWQAARAEQGWRIERVEQGPPAEQATLDVDGRAIGLRGRIDRIDVNEVTGERIVLDYKTSDRVEPPERSHRKKSAWVDLQLPLYRHLARALGIEGPVALGYIALSKDVSRIGLLQAEWSEAELEDADETARQVVRDIRGGKFWPPADTPPAFCEEFSAICQDGRFGAARVEDDDELEEAAP